ncbi:hypothetical protein [Roseomonas gilardii]|uniref:hypothetical protein n=1 Tax=Roseomonas gilardii TaxID=257708 RepID=UPI0004829808|nr:hypothetical protein [Roseomonas gilardii]SUE44968.1 Uncharacterised protein [Roseomonas gilardii subsp. rosea]
MKAPERLVPGRIRGPSLTRRALLPVAGLLLPSTVRAAAPRAATILVPGPEQGSLALWTQRLSQRTGRVGPLAMPPRLAVVGGPDGVTAANRFVTMDSGDGRLLLTLPGAAMLAHLSGSERVGYDPRSWTPLCLSWSEALIAGRGTLPAGPGRMPLRFALPAPDTPEGGAILALESLGLPTTPMPLAASLPDASEHAFAQGQIDALLLTGPNSAARAARIGATPWLGFGLPPRTVPDYATLPVPQPALQQATQAVIGAGRLSAALVLPALTSADMVAAWRQAAQRWLDAEQNQPGAPGIPLSGAEAAQVMSGLTPSAEAILAWRDWLARRLSWRPN